MSDTSNRFRLTLLGALVALAAVGASPAAAQGGATLYTDEDFRGDSESFSGDVPRLAGSRVGNDAASSLRLAPGCTARLYDDEGYRGRETVLRDDSPRLAATAAGTDRVSSLRVSCLPTAPRGVTLFSDADFRGREGVFYEDEPDLRDDPFPNDAVSSLRVPDGCSVTLYSDPGFRGRSEVIYEDDASLGNNRVGNDSVSSLRVLCGTEVGGGARPGVVLARDFHCAGRDPEVSFRVEERGRDRGRATLLLGDAEVGRFHVDRRADVLHLRPIADVAGEVRIDLDREEIAVLEGGSLRTLCRLR